MEAVQITVCMLYEKQILLSKKKTKKKNRQAPRSAAFSSLFPGLIYYVYRATHCLLITASLTPRTSSSPPQYFVTVTRFPSVGIERELYLKAF